MARAVWSSREVVGAEVSALALCAGGGALAAGWGRALGVWEWARGAGWARVGLEARAHRHALTALAWSPAAPAALLASAGLDAALRFWALAAPRTLQPQYTPGEEGTLRLVGWGHAARSAEVRSLVWTRAGHMLLAGHADGCITVWTVRAGGGPGPGVHTQCLARLHSHEAALHALSLAAADSLLLACCMDGVLKLWRMRDVLAWGHGGEERVGVGESVCVRGPTPLAWEDAAHSLGVLCACSCPRGGEGSGEGGDSDGGEGRGGNARVATAGHDHAVRVWSIEEGALSLYTTFEGHESGVTDVRWATLPGAEGAEGADTLVSVSLDRTARVWQLGAREGEGRCVLVVAAHSRYITSLALDSAARFFITGSNDKSFKMWSLGTFSLEDDVRPPCNLLDHFGQGDLEGIEALPSQFDTPPAGSGADSGARSGADSGAQSGADSGARSGARVVYCAPGRGAGGGRRGRVASVACAPGRVATVIDSEVCVWSMSPLGTLESTWRQRCGGGGGVTSLAWLCDGRALLSAVAQRVTLWDTESGEMLREFRDAGETRGVAAVTSGAGSLILITGEKTLTLYQLDDPRPLNVWEGEGEGGAWCGALSASGTLMAAGAGGGGGGAGEGRLCVFSARAPYSLLAAHPAAHDTGVECVSFAASAEALHECEWDGDTYALATAGNDDYVRLWLFCYCNSEEEESRLECVRRVAAHGGGALCVVWCGVSETRAGEDETRVGVSETRAGAGEPRAGVSERALLVSGGGDGWVRVWAPRSGRALSSLLAQAPGQAPACDAVTTDAGTFVVCAGEDGALCVWALGEGVGSVGSVGEGGGEGGEVGGLWAETRLWRTATRWAHAHVLTTAGVSSDSEWGVQLLAAATYISGASLLDNSISALMAAFGFEEPPTALFPASNSAESLGCEVPLGSDADALGASDSAYSRVRTRLRAELDWLRVDEVPDSVMRRVPPGWRCPLRGGAGGAGPLRAPDGLSYCARALAAWTQAYGDVSPASGAPWSRDQLVPNAALRDSLRLAVRDAPGRHGT